MTKIVKFKDEIYNCTLRWIDPDRMEKGNSVPSVVRYLNLEKYTFSQLKKICDDISRRNNIPYTRETRRQLSMTVTWICKHDAAFLEFYLKKPTTTPDEIECPYNIPNTLPDFNMYDMFDFSEYEFPFNLVVC